MAIFNSDSRYVRFASIITTTDRRGRIVQALTPASPPAQRALGEHLRREGLRLDHLASRYLNNPEGFWQIAEHNNAMTPDILTEAASIKIPMRR